MACLRGLVLAEDRPGLRPSLGASSLRPRPCRRPRPADPRWDAQMRWAALRRSALLGVRPWNFLSRTSLLPSVTSVLILFQAETFRPRCGSWERSILAHGV